MFLASHPPAVVLVVDDEPLLRLGAVLALEHAGYATFEAGETDEALSQLDDHPEITVLFTDINMPGARDGLALAGLVHERRPDILVIVTSGRESPCQAELPALGRFIAKPYDPDRIGALVAEGLILPVA